MCNRFLVRSVCSVYFFNVWAPLRLGQSDSASKVVKFRLSSVLFYWHKLRGKLRDYDIVHLHGPAPTFIDVFLFMIILTREV